MEPNRIAAEIRKRAGTTIFSCTFVKRTTGERRVMVCRLGVVRALVGGEPPYDPKEHDLLTVWDTQKQGYRTIPLDAIESLKIRGEVYDLRDA